LFFGRQVARSSTSKNHPEPRKAVPRRGTLWVGSFIPMSGRVAHPSNTRKRGCHILATFSRRKGWEATILDRQFPVPRSSPTRVYCAAAMISLISLISVSPPHRQFCAQKAHPKRAYLRLFRAKTALNHAVLHYLSRVCLYSYAYTGASVSTSQRAHITPHSQSGREVHG
jgi:hypothetical protein